jgi:hypothetical protein
MRMARRAIVLAGFAAFGLALAPVATEGGSMAATGPKAPGFTAQPAFRPTSAFGSPGGFPFMPRLDRRIPRVVDRRVAPVVFFGFPFTSFLYAPSVPYAMATDAPPSVTNVTPVTYVSPTVYVSVPVVAAAPAPIATPSAPLSTPSVVEFATGRYELRGDGASTAYTWVWIPNPPPAPPMSPPDAPVSAASTAGRGQVYRWTDDQGTEFWTNRPEKIPEPYRSGAQDQARLAAQQ